MAILGAATFVLYIALQILPQLVLPKTTGPLHEALRLGSAVFLCVVMGAAYVAGVRLMECRAATELAWDRAAPANLLGGAAFGALLFGVVIALLAAAGAARIGASLGPAGLAPALATAMASAVGEEIIFRGVLFRMVEESAGTLVAIAVSASLFGLVHALNHGAGVVSTLAIALEAGVLLALVFAVSRSLWAPIGVHLGWNFTEGGVFGQAVSGGHAHGLFATSLTGGPLVTGGAFGPEASLAAMAVSLVASTALAALALHRGRWKRGPLRLRDPGRA